MSIYFCNREEVRGAMEHLETSKVVKILSSIPEAQEEYQDYLEAHQILPPVLQNLDKEDALGPLEVDSADEFFDDTCRSCYFYGQHMIYHPERRAERPLWESLMNRLLPRGRATVLLSYNEEIGVAAHVQEIITKDPDVGSLVQNTDLPKLAQHLVDAAQKLKTAIDRVTPKASALPSYKQARLNWIEAFNALRDRVGSVLQRQVRKGKRSQQQAEQMLIDLFHAVEELEQKAEARRNVPKTPSSTVPAVPGGQTPGTTIPPVTPSTPTPTPPPNT